MEFGTCVFIWKRNKGKRPVGAAQEARVRGNRPPAPGAARDFGVQQFLSGGRPPGKVAGPLLSVKMLHQRGRGNPRRKGVGSEPPEHRTKVAK